MARTATFASWLAELACDVAGMDPAVVGTLVAVSGAAGVYTGWRAWRSLRAARLIEDTPTSKARSVHQGYVELEGRTRPLDGVLTVAPLSATPCVWYRFQVEEDAAMARGRRWQVINTGVSTDTFWLEDDTGRVVVDPDGASVTTKIKEIWKSSARVPTGTREPAYIAGFLSTHSGRSYRFTEWRINVGDPLYAIGMLKNLGSHVGTVTGDEETRELLRVWKTNQAQLKQRFDRDRDGRIDSDEWAAARAEAARQVMRERRAQPAPPAEGLNLLCTTSDPARPFMLSVPPQRRLTQRLRFLAALYGLGFFAFGIAAIWLYNTKFGGRGV